MSIVTDPDDLDRFQICVDPIAETISIRGLGTQRHAVDSTGDSDGSTTFTDAGANFTGDGVQVGDILTIISDPADDGGIIGHYRITGSITGTTFVVHRAIPASTSANLTYKINAPQTPGAVTPQVSDGVSFQALYSFLKEEWKTLAGSLGNAEDLIQFDFPMLSITTEEFILGGTSGAASSAWSFYEDNGVVASAVEGTTRQLIRTGGWEERDNSNNVLRRYVGVITLGTLDTDAQVYYQQHSTTIDPEDFKLTGPVNQAVNIFDEVTGPDTGTGFAITNTDTITRNDGGNWYDDGYRVGGRITIRNAENAGNNGTWIIESVDDAVDGDLVVTGTLTNNAADTTMIAAVDKRFYLKLFVRKKGKSYASATEFNAGIDVSAGGFLRGKVEKFPLAHADDAAITLQDGQLAGDPAETVFRSVETHSTGSNGATVDNGDGTFSFTSATVSPAFNDGVLQPGDSLEIESGGYQGFFEIRSITDADTIVCYHEPFLTYPGDETSLTFTARTNTRDSGAANATLTDEGSGVGRLDSAGSTFNADNGLGDRTVVVGDVVLVTAGDNAVIGAYTVTDVRDADTLELDISDYNWAAGPFSNQTYIVKRPGMHLQRFETNATHVGPDGGTGFDFNNANPDTIDRNDGGNWQTNGYNVAGLMLTVTNASDPLNNGTYIVASATAGTITLIAEETLTADTLDTTAEFDGEYGIRRTINGVTYPFHWRLFANGGTLAQIFQFLQKELRRPIDIDEGVGISRGDITDLLMSFTNPTGTTLDLFPDDIFTGDLNNVTYQDMSGDSRNNAFIVGITFQVNSNLINSATKRLVAFFTDPNLAPDGNEFGSNGAIIVNDADSVPMDFTVIAGNIQTTFDYTNNSQGSRTPNTDADVTVVAIGDDLAQHVLVTDTITRVNSKTIAVLPALERNYSNPA